MLQNSKQKQPMAMPASSGCQFVPVAPPATQLPANWEKQQRMAQMFELPPPM